jgi:hypothetical protein
MNTALKDVTLNPPSRTSNVTQVKAKHVATSPTHDFSKNRPPWGGHKPRVKLLAGGQVPSAPSRSLAINTHILPINFHVSNVVGNA